MVGDSHSKVRKRLLIICQNQFGYHIDSYYYCCYLRKEFDVTYVCWNYLHPEIDMDGIEVLYVSRDGNKFVRLRRYLIYIISLIRKNNYNLCFIKYFCGCCLLKIVFPFKIFVFDIRTGCVESNTLRRWLSDRILYFESLFFPHVTAISQSLAIKIGLAEKAVILPLGADVISSKEKKFEEINLLYVGTLHQRNLDKTVNGFAYFMAEGKHDFPVTYTIIGYGYQEEERRLNELVDKLQLQDVVRIMGRVPHNQLASFFDSHNVGVAFVPITEFFDVQPVTKTFEHLVSGMPVIATATKENRLVVNDSNGILIDDTERGFCEGLKNLTAKRGGFDSKKIMKNAEKYRWEKIIAAMQKYLLSLCP